LPHAPADRNPRVDRLPEAKNGLNVNVMHHLITSVGRHFMINVERNPVPFRDGEFKGYIRNFLRHQ
jgi:hypothetical protein